jgi:hypothetical protein
MDARFYVVPVPTSPQQEVVSNAPLLVAMVNIQIIGRLIDRRGPVE